MKLNALVRAAVLAFTLASAGAAEAAAPLPQKPAPGVYRLQLGAIEVTALSDGTVTIPLDQLLTDVTPAALKASLEAAHLAPMAETSINAYLVNTGRHLVLVDTGAGELFKAMGAPAGRLLASLRNAGYAPEQVDAVLLTHIHGDHSGGLSVDGKALFPNATIHVDRRDAEFWLNPANRAKAAPGQRHGFDEARAMLGPYQAAGRIRTFDGAGELLPGISAVPARGHTPGHSFYAVQSEGRKLLLVGDLIHAAAVQLPLPATTIRFDVDSPAAARTRKAALEEMAKQGYMVGAAHLSYPGLGYVRRDGKGYRWAPVNYSAW